MSSTFVPPPSGPNQNMAPPAGGQPGFGSFQPQPLGVGMYGMPQQLQPIPSKPLGERVFGDTVGFIWYLFFFVCMVVASIIIPVSLIPVNVTVNHITYRSVLSIDGFYVGLVIPLLGFSFLIFYMFGSAIYRIEQQMDFRKSLMRTATIVLILSIAMLIVYILVSGSTISIALTQALP